LRGLKRGEKNGESKCKAVNKMMKGQPWYLIWCTSNPVRAYGRTTASISIYATTSR